MSFSLVKINDKPNAQNLKEYIMDSVSDVPRLPVDCADGSVAYTKNLSHVYTFLNGEWTEAGDN